MPLGGTVVGYPRHLTLILRVFSSSSLCLPYNRVLKVYCFPSLSDLRTTSHHRSSLWSSHPRSRGPKKINFLPTLLMTNSVEYDLVKILEAEGPRGVGGGSYLGQFLLGMCRWPLRAPTPLQSIPWPIIDPISVTLGQKCNFAIPTQSLSIYVSTLY